MLFSLPIRPACRFALLVGLGLSATACGVSTTGGAADPPAGGSSDEGSEAESEPGRGEGPGDGGDGGATSTSSLKLTVTSGANVLVAPGKTARIDVLVARKGPRRP